MCSWISLRCRSIEGSLPHQPRVLLCVMCQPVVAPLQVGSSACYTGSEGYIEIFLLSFFYQEQFRLICKRPYASYSWLGMCQLDIQAILVGIQKIQDTSSMLSTHCIYLCLFFSVLFPSHSSFFFYFTQRKKKRWGHEKFKIVIRPPVIPSVNFTCKAFSFPDWEHSQVCCIRC